MLFKNAKKYSCNILCVQCFKFIQIILDFVVVY